MMGEMSIQEHPNCNDMFVIYSRLCLCDESCFIMLEHNNLLIPKEAFCPCPHSVVLSGIIKKRGKVSLNERIRNLEHRQVIY